MSSSRVRPTTSSPTMQPRPGRTGFSGTGRTSPPVAQGPRASPGSQKRTVNPKQAPAAASAKKSSTAFNDDSESERNNRGGDETPTCADELPAMSRTNSNSLAVPDSMPTPQKDLSPAPSREERGLFRVIEELATLEADLWSMLDGLKSSATYVSYFCREYWGTSASQAQLSLERLNWNERLKRQVQQACVLESLSLGAVSHLCSGTMQDVSVTIRARLRNLLYYIHENCLVLLDLVCQRWLGETQSRWGGRDPDAKSGHCPENLNLDILIRVKRYRQLRKGEHIMALRQHNDMIANLFDSSVEAQLPSARRYEPVALDHHLATTVETEALALEHLGAPVTGTVLREVQAHHQQLSQQSLPLSMTSLQPTCH